MKITFFSIAMSVLWGSILMILYAALRKRYRLIDICSVSGVIILYLFCAIRMLCPIEFPWVRVIPAEHIFNTVYLAIRTNIGNTGLKAYHIAVAVWMLGTLLGLVWLVIRYRKQGQIIEEQISQGRIIDATQYDIADSSVRIIRTPAIQVPMSFGIIKKRILLPEGVYSYVEEKLIINHEYMHLRNYDLVVQMLINIFCAIYWWNPFAYLLRLNLEQYFELRCDSNVTKNMTDSQIADYLELLLKVYRYEKNRKVSKVGLGLLGTHIRSGQNIKERFIVLARWKGKKERNVGKITAIIIAGVLMVLSYSFIFQSNYEMPEIEILKDTGAFEIDQDNSYLLEKRTGSYVWITDNGFENEVSPDVANMLINEGFKVIKEEK